MNDNSKTVYPTLDLISSPADLKGLSAEELTTLCEEMRSFLLETVQETGGHLGSNIGVVELATALHSVYDFRRDRLVWDVSHQCYPHKILTGRRAGFDQLRKTGGMCGFTNPHESEYDLFHTGHAGTSISLALGLSLGMQHEKEPGRAVAVIGDASLGAGVAFEAINHAGSLGQPLLVVLNDNEWSISKTVGAMARYLSRIRSSRIVQRAQQEISSLIQTIPLIGPKVDKTLEQVGEVLSHYIIPGHVFQELGVTYVGPVDGHDVNGLIKTLERVKELDGVVLLHLLTEKGKGHPAAPGHPERVHGVKGAAKPAPEGEVPVVPKPKGPAYTKAFSDSLIAAAERDVRVHGITAAMPSGTGLDKFSERHPSRFHDTGITEQHAIAMSAGMAKAGLRPVVAIYSTFLQRGYDQIFQEVALQGLPVLFCLDRAGMVGQDGPTHNGVFDLAYLRTFPGMTLMAPRDACDMDRMMRMALKHDGPMAMRFPRDTCPAEEIPPGPERRAMEPGLAEVLVDPPEDGLCIWAYGALVNQAREAVASLSEEGIQVGLVDARFAKPVDEELLCNHLRSCRGIITLEEHQRAGGFGSAVLECANRNRLGSASIRILAIDDEFVDHATSRDEQLAGQGLDSAGVARAVRGMLARVRES
jgi:1-deoxy-D-xylulose-5-phosphate synthase